MHCSQPIEHIKTNDNLKSVAKKSPTLFYLILLLYIIYKVYKNYANFVVLYKIMHKIIHLFILCNFYAIFVKNIFKI